MRNVLVVISGPSGVGKGTIAKRICQDDENVFLSISATTRAPRVGEENGREYFFIDKDEFKREISEGGFLEYSEHFENYYGTPKKFVLDKLSEKDIILEIDVNGGLNVKKSYQDTVLIMILPPSVEEIRKRLIKRNTETLEKIELRMQRIEYEVEKKDLYDYVVINDDLETAVERVKEIIKKEKLK